MQRILYGFAVTLLSILTCMAFSQNSAQPQSETDTISGSGCVSAGVEAGCLILQDTKTKKDYNLFFPSGKKPAKVGMAIEFLGTPGGPNTCQQGYPIYVSDWHEIRMHCPTDLKNSKKRTKQ